MKKYTVFDLETDGLLDDVSKIHCLSYAMYEDGKLVNKGSITDYKKISYFVLHQEVLVGHNITRYDIPVLEKLLDITVEARLVDTLGLSWYLYPNRIRHGLEVWGEDLGVLKPTIVDWRNLSIEEYIHRCESDVEINSLLFQKQIGYLVNLYEANSTQINNIVNYLGYKLDCAKEQEDVKCLIDIEVVDKSLEELYAMRDEKIANLVEVMPLNIGYKEINKPNKMFRKDETLSVAGVKWMNLLAEEGLPLDYEDVVTIKISEENGNPGSSTQLKNWLFGLGWEPRTFEHRKNKAGDVKAVPQIYEEDGVCSSIKELYPIEPALENLDMLSLINHRVSIFEGYKAAMNNEGYVRAEVAGFTNTLRFKHKKPIVNLPKVFKFYGEKVRGAIIAPGPEYLLCGSDMSSLEDTTKQHYMYYFDPEYVSQMRVPGFDPHIDIGVLSRIITQEESDFFKWYNDTKKEIKEGLSNHVFSTRENTKMKDIGEKRGKAKVVNFAGVYGAGPPKIALSTGMSLSQAKTLHKTYWSRNKSVKQVAASVKTKTITIDGEEQMWLLNPVSGFWYSLRYEKDKFSTLNQGTGVYCFDLWVRQVRLKGIKIMIQYHDEIVFYLRVGEEDQVNTYLLGAIEAVNNSVKLNVPLGVSVDFGNNYAEIH